jgi:hypothetical protein
MPRSVGALAPHEGGSRAPTVLPGSNPAESPKNAASFLVKIAKRRDLCGSRKPG